jgi:hypothetical protein
MLEGGWLYSAGRSFATDLDPLIVTSPVQRSGTTLLQRLLCSSPETLIFGEKPAQDLKSFLTVYAQTLDEHAWHRNSSQRTSSWSAQVEGNDASLGLTPDADGYRRVVREATFAGVSYCRDYARSNGRLVWGFKHRAWSPDFIQLLRRAMPKARLLFIVRDLVPALKSAKAHHLVGSEQDLREFCLAWLNGTAYCDELRDDPCAHVVRYEELVEDPAWTLSVISEFSGASQMDLSILGDKVSTWTRQSDGSGSINEHTPPAELTGGELKIIEGIAAGFGVSISV